MTRLALLLTLILAASSPRPVHDIPALATSAGTEEPDRGRTGASSSPVTYGRTGVDGLVPGPEDAPSSVPVYHLTRQGGPNPATAVPLAGVPFFTVSPFFTPTVKNGIASWYGTGPDGLYAAAGPALRVGDWRGSTVTVCAERCIRVRLTDYCECYAGTDRERIVDLSDDAFRALAPLSRGLVRVTVGA